MPNDRTLINWGHLSRFASNLKVKFNELLGDITGLNDYLKTHYRFKTRSWTVKGLNIDTSGTAYYYSRNDRLTCTNILPAVAGTTIKASTGYEINVYHFASNKMTAPSYKNNTEWISEYTFTSSDYAYFMVVLRRTDNANISVSEGGIGIYEVGDITASV